MASRRKKKPEAMPPPAQEFGVLMLVRDRDEQKARADAAERQLREQLDPESVQHWDTMRADRDEARAALIVCLNAMTVASVKIPDEAKDYFRKRAVEALT